MWWLNSPFKTLPAYVGKQLSFAERRTLSKLSLGVLPIRIETGRVLRPILPENMPVYYCNSGKFENETYILFECQM